MMGAIAMRPEPGITKAACAAMGVTRSSFYRRRTHLAQLPAEPRPRPRPMLRRCPYRGVLRWRTHMQSAWA